MRNDTIDGFRLIAAFFVVCLHAGLPGMGAILTPFYRMAVPFFFLISGFYLYDSDRQHMNCKILKSMKRIGLIWFQATLVYIVVTFLCFPEDWFNQLRLFFSFKFWLLNIAPFNSVLWYLLAYLYTLALIYGLNNLTCISKLRGRIFLFLIIPGLIVNYCIGEFHFLFMSNDIDLIYQSNFITLGFPIVMIGIFSKKYMQYLPKISSFKYIFWLLIFYIIAIIQWYIIKKLTHESVSTNIFFFSTLPMIILTLSYALYNPNLFKNMIPKWGRLYSLDIYVYHVMFLWFILTLGKYYSSIFFIKNAVVVFLLTFGFAAFKRFVKLKIG